MVKEGVRRGGVAQKEYHLTHPGLRVIKKKGRRDLDAGAGERRRGRDLKSKGGKGERDLHLRGTGPRAVPNRLGCSVQKRLNTGKSRDHSGPARSSCT